MFPFLWLLAFVASISIVRFLRRYLRARSQFPGPPVKNFWTGNLDETMADNVHDKWLRWNRDYGHVFQTWNGPLSRIIYIGDPAMIAKILVANWRKASAQYDGFRPLNGDALFVQTNHERWKIQRKRLSPAFRSETVALQYPYFVKHLANLIQQLDGAAKRNTVVDISSLNVLLTLDFMGDIAYGVDLHALSQGKNCRIVQLFDTILPELIKCGLFPLRAALPILGRTRRMHRAIDEVRTMAVNAVESARQIHDASKGESENRPSNKIFDILTRQRELDGSFTFTSKELVDNYVTFLVAGADTTAHTMSFLIYEVVRNPEILATLRAELDAKLPYDVLVPSLDQVKLPYLNMLLKETLRYNSTGFGTFRTCPADTEISGIILPANTTLALWNPAVHRDPRLWEDPDTFNPERWRSDERKMRGSYFPFSYGPRNCLGQGLAMFEMTITIATLFRRYNLSLKPGFEMEYLPSFTLRPKHGLPIYVTRRSS